MMTRLFKRVWFITKSWENRLHDALATFSPEKGAKTWPEREL